MWVCGRLVKEIDAGGLGHASCAFPTCPLLVPAIRFHIQNLQRPILMQVIQYNIPTDKIRVNICIGCIELGERLKGQVQVQLWCKTQVLINLDTFAGFWDTPCVSESWFSNSIIFSVFKASKNFKIHYKRIHYSLCYLDTTEWHGSSSGNVCTYLKCLEIHVVQENK